MREKLMALDEAGTPIRVAIIGCGRFGSMMVSQIKRAPGMTVSIGCDLNVQRAADVLETAGYDGEATVTDDPEDVFESDVDVVVEVTGNPDVGALHSFKAISSGKHVVNVNVEADVLVGPLLRQMAEQAGVVYSLAYGDQPAVIEEMYDWAASMGFEIPLSQSTQNPLLEYPG